MAPQVSDNSNVLLFKRNTLMVKRRFFFLLHLLGRGKTIRKQEPQRDTLIENKKKFFLVLLMDRGDTSC